MDYWDVKPGDYIYAQGGVCVNRVSEAEAREALKAWKEVFFELRKTDSRSAALPEIKRKGAVFEVVQKINRGKKLSDNDALILLRARDKEEVGLICAAANNIRRRVNKNACCVHGIIEFSNYCSGSCHYCGIRKEKNIQRYRMSIKEIEDAAFNAIRRQGFKALVLQSGEESFYSAKELAPLIKNIRALGALLFLSPGTKSKEFYSELYSAGARAALLRFETHDRSLFEKLRPGTSLADRINKIKFLKEKKFVTATGFLLGLPGEKPEDILANIRLAGSLEPDMISFGPLLPVPGTPLEGLEPVSEEKVLKTIALIRILYPKSSILITSAMETLYEDMPRSGLEAGGNSMMIDVTPRKYREKYTIYPGKGRGGNSIREVIKKKTDMLYSLGRAPTDLGI